jgi:hypothetical protein
VVSLHNLPRKAVHREPTPLAFPQAQFGTQHYLAPQDFSAIYGLDALGAVGVDGAGVTVAIVGRTNPGLKDVAAFRAAYGLPAGRTAIVLNGPDPGSVSPDEDVEANLDMQWAGATAPGASIRFICSGSTATTDGVDLSALHAVDENVASVISLSFGACESDLGTAGTAYYGQLWAQAAAQGISVCVASGDAGAAGCDAGDAATGTTAGVNGLGSSPNAFCVGGTQFLDGTGTWWSSAGGALGYIPEAAWNESALEAGGTGLWATGGGASRIYAKPWWQTGPGVPQDGQRDVPDVAFTAAGHDAYLMRSAGALYAVGGTSASTPSFAGILARLVQKSGQRQGAAHPQLYALARLQPGAGVFHDTLQGGNSVPGVKGFPAGPGYDAATGLGSLDGTALVNALAGLLLTPQGLSAYRNLGAGFSQAYAAGGGTGPFAFSVASGQLPPGLSLGPDGTLSGTCVGEGSYAFTVEAVDSTGRTGTTTGSIQVGPVNVTSGLASSGQMTGLPGTYSALVTGAVDTSVTWSATGGVLTLTGANQAAFTAQAPGSYAVIATSNANPARACSIQVDVHDADFVDNHAGKPLTGLDALYLAGWIGQRNSLLDLTGDALVDAHDVNAVLDAMGW